MTIGRLRVRLRRQDEGAILIIALIVITVVALVTGVVLTRGEGSLRTTVALRDVAGTTYAADGAAQVALNALRTGYWDGNAEKPAGWAFNNSVGDGCFGRNITDSILTPDDAMELQEFYPAPKSTGEGPTSAYVECVPETATGAQATVRHVTNANSPGDAIITLGTGEVGLATSNKTLKVRGGIRVNSNITANGPIEVSEADVRARTGCSGTINVSPGRTKNCASGAVSDPNYAADTTTIPELRTPPTSCTSNVAVFEPGYYDDVAALNTATTRCTLAWFKPGTYYFDFHNDSGNGDPLYQSGIATGSSNEWTLGGKVLAGTPVNSSGTVLAAPPSNATLPGSCQNPIDTANAQGVQFIFGGDSRVKLSGTAELCATYRTNRPPIVMYGLKSGANPDLTTLTGASGALTTSGTPTVTGTGSDPATFTPLTAATFQDADSDVSTWQRTSAGSNSETRTITLGGFAPPAVIAKGAVLKDARLIVRHKSAQNNGGTASTIRITPSAPGTTALNAFNLSRPGTLTTQTVDLRSTLSAAQWSLLAKGIHDNGYTGASIAYTATVGKNQSAQLDAVRLELEYYVPQLRGPSAISDNCVTTVGSGGCSIISPPANGQAELYLQGTTYLPLGKVSLNIKNTEAQVFRWGIIARALDVNVNGAFKFDGAVIELPDNSPGFGLDGTLVQMKVYVCPGSATCSASGRLALKVRAQLWDDSGETVAGDRQVTVLSWSHQR